MQLAYVDVLLHKENLLFGRWPVLTIYYFKKYHKLNAVVSIAFVLVLAEHVADNDYGFEVDRRGLLSNIASNKLSYSLYIS